MRVAIMQPYLFPYIGYFQLMNAVDRWVVYDDVAFIKQGWINRNRILINGEPQMFTVPLHGASSFVLINQTEINQRIYPIWKSKFYKTLEQSYRKAPNFDVIFPLIKEVLDTEHKTISALALHGLKAVTGYLEISTTIVESSASYNNNDLRGEYRVLDICRQENAMEYINVPGGKHLYDKLEFEKKNIELHFIEPKLMPYNQFKGSFVPWLSIIDVLCFNSKEQIHTLLKACEIQTAQ